jgi:hypothetical protein
VIARKTAADWALALLTLYAEDAFQNANGGPVLPDPRLSPRWSVEGVLTGVDALCRFGKRKLWANRVFYGWKLRSKTGQCVLVIRGTQRPIEWVIDGLFAPRTAHPVKGRVESGFWSVAESLLLDGTPLDSAAKDVDIVVGHSLGAAVATYVSLALTQAGAKVRGVFVASPHPGDVEFSKAFGAAVPHVMYRNAGDIVPRVPFWFGYSHVPNVMTLSPSVTGVIITGGLGAQHHALTYATLMSRTAYKTFKPLPCDKRFVDCIQFDK